MGFNYLQTDDRDDYFASLRPRNRENRTHAFHTITDKEGNVLLKGLSGPCISFTKKRLNLTKSQVRPIWKDLLTKDGLTITTIRV